MRPPWHIAGAVSQDPASYPYELYDLTKDWTQYDNVAAKYPAKLKELENLFWVEASKYQVLPLDASAELQVHVHHVVEPERSQVKRTRHSMTATSASPAPGASRCCAARTSARRAAPAAWLRAAHRARVTATSGEMSTVEV